MTESLVCAAISTFRPPPAALENLAAVRPQVGDLRWSLESDVAQLHCGPYLST
jgi:hypothetical protein